MTARRNEEEVNAARQRQDQREALTKIPRSRWRLRCGWRRSPRVGGGSWSHVGKKRETPLNTARRRERQRDWGKRCIAHGSREFCEATPIHWPSLRVQNNIVRARDAPRPA